MQFSAIFFWNKKRSAILNIDKKWYICTLHTAHIHNY